MDFVIPFAVLKLDKDVSKCRLFGVLSTDGSSGMGVLP
jgi:hypothetical protein